MCVYNVYTCTCTCTIYYCVATNFSNLVHLRDYIILAIFVIFLSEISFFFRKQNLSLFSLKLLILIALLMHRIYIVHVYIHA